MWHQNNSFSKLKGRWLSFDSLHTKILAIVGLIGIGYTIGYYLTNYRFDKEKNELAKANEQLSLQVDRLNMRIHTDSLEKWNWRTQNSTRIIFNDPTDTSLKLPFLTLVNSSVKECQAGSVTPTPCWEREAHATPGDYVSVQIFYKNNGDFIVDNVSTGFGFLNTSDKAISIGGGIRVGNKMIYKDAVAVLTTEPCNIELAPIKAWWYKNGDPTRINTPDSVQSSKLISNEGLNIGSVAPGEYGNIIAVLRLVKK